MFLSSIENIFLHDIFFTEKDACGKPDHTLESFTPHHRVGSDRDKIKEERHTNMFDDITN